MKIILMGGRQGFWATWWFDFSSVAASKNDVNEDRQWERTSRVSLFCLAAALEGQTTDWISYVGT